MAASASTTFYGASSRDESSPFRVGEQGVHQSTDASNVCWRRTPVSAPPTMTRKRSCRPAATPPGDNTRTVLQRAGERDAGEAATDVRHVDGGVVVTASWGAPPGPVDEQLDRLVLHRRHPPITSPAAPNGSRLVTNTANVSPFRNRSTVSVADLSSLHPREARRGGRLLPLVVPRTVKSRYPCDGLVRVAVLQVGRGLGSVDPLKRTDNQARHRCAGPPTFRAEVAVAPSDVSRWRACRGSRRRPGTRR